MWDILLQHLPFTILIILAIIICGADLIKAISVWKAKRKERIQQGVQEQQEKNTLTETLKNLQTSINFIHEKFDKQDERFEEIEIKIKDLTESDMHDIKAWIVEQYHKFYIQQGWIDAFSADTLDHRYEDYKKEGGNSYIDTLMNQLHTLPMDPELSIVKKKL